MTPADKGRRIAIVTAAAAVMPLAALATNMIHGVVAERDAARARAGALQQRIQHQPPPVTVTPAPVVKPSASPLPSLTGTVTVGPTVVAAGPAGSSGTGGGSGGGVGARPVGGQPTRTPPTRTPPSSPSSPSRPPRRDTCSTVRVAVDRPPLGVLACGSVQTTARIGRPVP